MNDAALTELKVVVERAVRPVRATMAGKRRMREELLAHLVAIFEEEAQKTVDEQTALDVAKGRFGDPTELTEQLQQAVPRRDRAEYWNEKMLQYQPGETLLHFAGKFLLLTFVAYCIGLPVVLAIWITGQRPHELGLQACVMGVALIWGIAPLMAVELAGAGMRRAFSKADARRSLRLTLLCVLASLPIVPLSAFLTYWALTGDLGASLLHLRFACYFAPAAAVLLALLARKRAKELRYENEWASLEIGE